MTKKVTLQNASKDDSEALAKLAQICWLHHYVDIIGRDQVDYMLETFQSVDAIDMQIAEGRAYFFILASDARKGYLACDVEETQLFISKLYVLPDCQRQGYGRQALDMIRKIVPDLPLALTVNKENAAAIAFYEAYGFGKTGSVVVDIGNGFVMDDFEMRFEPRSV